MAWRQQWVVRYGMGFWRFQDQRTKRFASTWFNRCPFTLTWPSSNLNSFFGRYWRLREDMYCWTHELKRTRSSGSVYVVYKVAGTQAKKIKKNPKLTNDWSARISYAYSDGYPRPKAVKCKHVNIGTLCLPRSEAWKLQDTMQTLIHRHALKTRMTCSTSVADLSEDSDNYKSSKLSTGSWSSCLKVGLQTWTWIPLSV